MNPELLFREGKLDEAIAALGDALRSDPSNTRNRTFLFELLCFAGEYDRAEKHLRILGDAGKDALAAGLLYLGALHAERIRQGMFAEDRLPAPAAAAPFSGALNGKPFRTLADGDARIGARLEVLAGGDYLWIPFEHIAELTIEPPRRLRDLLWASARLRTGPGFRGQDLGEVLIPAIAAGSAQHEDNQVRLGRVTEWYRDEKGNEFPLGRKLWLVDGEEMPLLEVRTLEIHSTATASAS
ncbi:MAG TPA: type VI secretion system accessory protein TagJ [Bryobacteraceae bacterium]|nr:type VI secretion system accessory protein TagJ [Bryobacteraceae bacterium]